MECNAQLPAVDKGMKQKFSSGKTVLLYVWPLLAFFKIFGLATFSVVGNVAILKGKSALPVFVRSRFGRLYNLLLIAAIISSLYATIPSRIRTRYPGWNGLTMTIEVFQAVLGAITICSILLSFCFYEAMLVKAGNRLMNIELSLHQVMQPINRVRILRLFLCAGFVNICILGGVLTTETLAFEPFPVTWLTDMLPTFLISLYFIQYFFIISLLIAYFTDVNRGMQCLAKNSTTEPLYQTHRLLVSGSSIRTLLQLRNIYGWLCETSNDISQLYSVPALFSIAFLFLTLVYNAYYFVLTLAIDKSMILVYLANSICWIVAVLYPVLLLTWKITKINTEIQKLGNIVHTLLNYTFDREMKTQLKLLSLEVLHRDIKFTANGFFVLDNTLFHSIISAATTYLVIILQFQMGANHSTCPPRNCT